MGVNLCQLHGNNCVYMYVNKTSKEIKYGKTIHFDQACVNNIEGWFIYK